MHNFNLVYITLFFVFGIAMSASPLGILNIGRLDVTWKSCERLFAKEEAFCYFNCHNPSTFESYALTLCCMDQKIPISRIPAQKTVLVKLPLMQKKRGRVEIKECSLESFFPLYTIRFILPFICSKERMIYPRPAGLSLQEYLAKRKAYFGDELDFDGIRHDTDAQNLARIHWPSVAKGESAVKVFDHDLPHDTLHFEFQSAGENDEARLSQLTLWALECEQKSLDFEILLPHERLQSKRMEIDEILSKLALY